MTAPSPTLLFSYAAALMGGGRRRGWIPWLGLLLLIGSQGSPVAAQETTVSPHGALSLDCLDCHREDGWKPARVGPGFDHARFGYPLVGAHGAANCMGCHQDLTFAGTPRNCAACHQDPHRGELGADCAACHTERTFLDRGRMLQRHQESRFTLEGAHRAADCESCHPRAQQGLLQFVGRPVDCQGCHVGQFTATRNPDHVAAGFARDCERCHAATLWTTARFNHDQGGFPLSGAHRTVACAECHVGNQYAGTQATCVNCHQEEYDATVAPPHAAANFTTDCAACHGTRSWNSSFDHSRSSFPLTGAHKTVACDLCHDDGVFSGKPTACEACHLTDFRNTTNPDHELLAWPESCRTCHSGSSSTVAWDMGVRLPSQYHTMFSVNHEGAGGRCAECHITADFRQSTCSQHHHPPSCTFANRGQCDD